MNIAAIDVVILIAYLILTIIIGIKVSKRVNNVEDFSVGGRSFGPFALAATFGATNFSTWSMVGKPGVVYNSGISVAWIALNACACILAAVAFVPIYRKLQYSTMSEIFEDRYDGKVRSLISVIWIIADTMNRFGVTTYAAAVIISMLFGLPLRAVIVVTAILVVIYTYIGGLVSVVVTDVIQFVLMWIGLFIGAIFIFKHFGGWNGLAEAIPTEMLNAVPDASSPNGWPWILAMTLLGFPYFITSQFVMQRGLGAKTVNAARWGLIFAGIIAIPMALMEILPGLAAKSMLDPATVASMSPDMVGPTIYLKLLPVGLTGVFFSAMIAAGLSTADSALCASASLITEDFYRKLNPNKTSKHYLKVSRTATIILAILGTAWALLVPKIGGALDAILNIIAITDMPIFIIVVLGLFLKKINATGALIGILSGTIAGAIVSFTGTGGIQSLAFTTATSSLVSLFVAVIVSYVTKQSTKEKTRLDKFFARISE